MVGEEPWVHLAQPDLRHDQRQGVERRLRRVLEALAEQPDELRREVISRLLGG